MGAYELAVAEPVNRFDGQFQTTSAGMPLSIVQDAEGGSIGQWREFRPLQVRDGGRSLKVRVPLRPNDAHY